MPVAAPLGGTNAAAARNERFPGTCHRLLGIIFDVPDQTSATIPIFIVNPSCIRSSKNRTPNSSASASMPPHKKNSPAPQAAAAAVDFDWDAGRDYRPNQHGYQYEVYLPLDEEEQDTVAAAACWIDYALSDCWAPMLLRNPKRCRVTLEERPSIEADPLRSKWESHHEALHPTLYSPPNLPDELLTICELRKPYIFYDYAKGHKYHYHCEMEDGDHPDEHGTYRPCNSILKAHAQVFTPTPTPTLSPSPSSPWPASSSPPVAQVVKHNRKLVVPKVSKPSVPRSSLLDRFMGLDPKLSHRTRILAMHWAALQMTRADGHKSWKLSGFIPFDPGIVLEPLGIERNIKQCGIAKSLRLQESRYLQDIQETVNNEHLASDVKFLKIHDILMRALNADVWQRRSIFADKEKKQAAESDSSSDCDSSSSNSDASLSTIPAYGAIGANIARRLEKQQIKNQEKLIKSKPFACKICAIRYKKLINLTKHIQEKHPSYPTADAEADAFGQPSAERTRDIIEEGEKKQHRYCELCGGLANHRANHAKTKRHKDAVAKQLLLHA